MFRPISSLVYPSHFNAKPDKNFMSMLMGLVDGDGYIEIGPQKQYNKSSVLPKSTIRARLVIRLNNRDRDLLVYITKVLGGRFNFKFRFRKSNQINHLQKRFIHCNNTINKII